MKRIFVIILLSALTTAASAHVIGCVDVNFSGLTTTDITVPNSHTLNGVTLSFDNGGGTDTASIDSSGIFGGTNGALIFAFSAPATGLYLDFSLLGVVTSTPGTQDIADGLDILTFSGGAFVDFAAVTASFTPYNSGNPNLGDAIGSLAYTGPAFDQVVLYFSTASPNFCAGNICYVPAPEPATICILSLGALSFVRRNKLA
jgi:hypothetical protein